MAQRRCTFRLIWCFSSLLTWDLHNSAGVCSEETRFGSRGSQKRAVPFPAILWAQVPALEPSSPFSTLLPAGQNSCSFQQPAFAGEWSESGTKTDKISHENYSDSETAHWLSFFFPFSEQICHHKCAGNEPGMHTLKTAKDTYITCQEPGANFLPLWIKYSAVLVQV